MAIHDEPIANIILNGEKLKPFPLKSGRKQGCPLSPLLLNSLGIPNHSNKTGRRNKRNTNWKGKSQAIPICRQHSLKNSTKKLLDTIRSLSKVSGHKINLQKSVAILYSNNEQTKKEYRKIIPFTIASKK
jgi:hypothetical protein